MSRLDELGRQIAREQDALRARSSLRADVRDRLDTLELPPARAWTGRLGPVPLWAAAAACAACVLGGALSLSLWTGKEPPAALSVTIGEQRRPGAAGSWVEAPSKAGVAMRFSDGTRVEVAPNSRARIAELNATGAHLMLENGLAHVHVKHRPNATFRVSAGPFAIKVTGTRFDVRWTPEQDAFELDLHEGRVELSGCVFGQSYELSAGQRAIASCRRGRLNVGSASELADKSVTAPEPAAATKSPAMPGHAAAIAPVLTPAATPAPDVSARSRAQAGRSRTSRSPAALPRWQVFAQAGRYADALDAVRNSGFATECRRANAAQLLLLSDLARYGRDHADAAFALRLVRQRFPGTRQAARAAFGLGRLDSDQDGSHAEAAGWFRTYLREQPGGSLAREASGRLLEATLRTGDTAGARELASQYLREYPTGPHAPLASGLRSDSR
jgi:transmembrane sensor